MARTKRVESISTAYSIHTCGPVDRPIVVDEYEEFADLLMNDDGDEWYDNTFVDNDDVIDEIITEIYEEVYAC